MKNKKKLRFPKKSLPTGLDKCGAEICDSKPTELRAKIIAPVTLRQKMKELWKDFSHRQEEANSIESIQDAADFDVSNDDFPISQYETEGSLKHVLDYVDEEVKAAVSAQQELDAESIKAEGEPKGEQNEANS